MLPSTPRTPSDDPLSREGLKYLKTYSYSSEDKSWISRYILRHYWNWAAGFLPEWMAPNLVTLIGFFPIVFSVLMLSVYIPDLVGPGPSWFYFFSAFVVWFYSTMDNIDGKQARRTNSSSPLGELFDHGLDAVNCTLASLLHVAAMKLGSTKMGAFTAILPCLSMYFSSWETYHTHTLYLGYINGPTEGLLISVIMMLMSSVYGPEIWTVPLRQAFPVLAGLVQSDASVVDLWVGIMGGAFLVFHLPGCIMNVYDSCKKGPDGPRPFLPLIQEWIPMGVFTGSCIAWLGSPHSIVLKENHLILFCVMLSVVFGRMTTKIVLAHLTRRQFPMGTGMLIPVVAGAVMTNLPLFGLPAPSAVFELLYLRVATAGLVVYYLVAAYRIIDTICDHLDISCFTLAPRKERY